MKMKKFLGVVIVLTITTSALAFTSNIAFIYPPLSGILFASEKGIEEPTLGKNSENSDQQFEILPSQQNSQAIVQTTKQDNEEVPDKVVYFILFHHLVSLKQESVKVAARGKTLDYFKMYEDQASLNDTQSMFLFETAQNCMDAVKVIDDKAREIITERRAKLKDIKSRNDAIPPPSLELKELQKQKDETVLRFRDQFKSFLGADRFNEFNDFARQKITPQVTNLDKKEEK